ncbi:nitroreductase family deazaflavin-dependent oxidoreductase [Rhodococcus sp. ACS1]|uniref:Deazaflavin-dependent oxidoreductase, nitroreductase family n=1 Tax=Rhodococcus koreensis TaxID=99653 RepID=A0A1H5BEJ0_9NOCA|nr:MULTISPECIES: nitroreductase family deazaflavin-dependent oxidoreductase [Rhodococcus]PBC44811.1 nitroreductase family deazaflavin-dependent oxidoreductase [Rhodococcus sp. ACS1]QSE78442.1 nitroreductase family deazaflavin-dependent oxidoreductase [Rhodococcus koreensis]SED52661.1 deazaflavin-dependent oxidoreductase, nitroreductase family [Rhodococcus koreensis]
MALPRSIARFNRVLTNRVSRRVATILPGFAVVEHRGRTSGRTYRTPVNVFVVDGRYRFALTYGAHSDWVRNVVAAGGCTIVTRRRTVHLTDPRIGTDGTHSWAPPGVRTVLEVIAADQYLECSPG